MPTVQILRYPWVARTARRAPKADFFDETFRAMRVLPIDCDFNLHINNGRYLSIMDLGRIDHATRTGWWATFRARGWNPVATGVTIRFRRELRIGARYRLYTKLAGWDERWFFFEQRFERADGSLAARAYVKAAVLDKGRRPVAPREVVAELGADPTSPQLPNGITTWQQIDAG
ncbi:MAG: thioesterase [Thermoleophilia bacterium]|nr:thioesterase [Thermoleophilia bacterium]